MNKLNQILKEVIGEISPSAYELKGIKKQVNEFTSSLQGEIKKRHIDAIVFVGGSFAKETLIKKGNYDIDVFVRFGKNHNEKEISNLLEKCLKGTKAKKIHGSRDYFRIDYNRFFIEIIPVLAVKNPKEAENITDLSYFHVNYIKKKLNSKMLDEIKLAKAFCHATKSYGAESYVNGFSGYALELLIYKYKSFLNFIKAMAGIKERVIIDIEKHYKNKNETVMNMNTSKMKSPVILIDPTYKERNALAALSLETFSKFQIACRKFLKSPDKSFFETKKIDFEKSRENAKRNRNDFALVEIETGKQEGDIAGSKLLKFYRHLKEETSRLYEIKSSDFEYNEEKKARFFFSAKNKNEIIIIGPMAEDKKNANAFNSKHKKTFIKNKRWFAKEDNKLDIAEFIREWTKKNKRKISEMDIKDIKILD